MRRVYAIWILKKLTSPLFMKFLILVGMIRVSFSMVSIPNILKNSPSFLDTSASYQFFTTAFWHTEIGVKFIAVMILVFLCWLVRDLFKSAPEFQMKRA
jgi:hypothetical protein